MNSNTNLKDFRIQYGQQDPAIARQYHDAENELVFLHQALDSASSEISQLKDEAAVLREKILFPKSKVSFVQPPVEVLQMIFSWALPPSFLLDPSLAAGPQSAWSQALRLKKSIVRVCQMWHAVGAEFLYEDVVFRRIGQIPAFIRTLDTSTRISGNLVKKITISAYVPRRYGRSCSEHLQHIFSRCRHIYKFALASPNCLPDVVTLPVHNVHITTLEVNDTFKYQSLLPVLTQVCDTLLSLSFHPNNSGDLHTALCFPDLKSLVCISCDLESTKALAVISSAWSLPSLESLALDMHSWSWTANDKPILGSGTVHSFCLTHGKHLRFLLVGPGHRFPTPKMQEIVDACPSLEHLVMRLEVSPLSIAHRNIKWIDLWSYENPYWFTSNYPWKMTVCHRASNIKDTPALRGVRTLTNALSLMFDVPMFISPSWAADSDNNTFSIQYPGIDIRFEQGFLYNFSPIGQNGGYAAVHGKDSDFPELDISGDGSDDEEYIAGSDETDSSSFISDTASVTSSSSSVDDDIFIPEFSDY